MVDHWSLVVKHLAPEMVNGKRVLLKPHRDLFPLIIHESEVVLLKKPGSKNSTEFYIMPIGNSVQWTRRVQKTTFFDLPNASSALLQSQISNCNSQIALSPLISSLVFLWDGINIQGLLLPSSYNK